MLETIKTDSYPYKKKDPWHHKELVNNNLVHKYSKYYLGYNDFLNTNSPLGRVDFASIIKDNDTWHHKELFNEIIICRDIKDYDEYNDCINVICDQNYFISQIVHNHITNIINIITIPPKWIVDGISAPNIVCKEKSKEVCFELFDKYGLIPSKITATIEEGIFIKYINPTNNKRILSIEVYNDLDIAAIITEKKETVIAKDIENSYFADIIKIFYE